MFSWCAARHTLDKPWVELPDFEYIFQSITNILNYISRHHVIGQYRIHAELAQNIEEKCQFQAMALNAPITCYTGNSYVRRP